jgi:hypothetical protein
MWMVSHITASLITTLLTVQFQGDSVHLRDPHRRISQSVNREMAEVKWSKVYLFPPRFFKLPTKWNAKLLKSSCVKDQES